MEHYYVNKIAQANGDHEIHTDSCSHKPDTVNALYLGVFENCANAVKEAKKYYSKSNGCYYCCKACHTS